MNQITSKTVLSDISKIYEAAKKSRFKTSSFESVRKELEYLSDRLQVDEEGTILFCLIFTLNFENSTVSYHSIGSVIKTNVVQVMALVDVFEELKRKGLITERTGKDYYNKTSYEYFISDEVRDAILKNHLPFERKSKKFTSAINVLEAIYDILRQRADDEINGIELYSRISEVLDLHENEISLVFKVKKLDLSSLDQAILLYILWKTLSGEESVGMSWTLEGLIKSSSKRISYSQSIILGKNPLICKGLVEVEKATFFNNSNLKLGPIGIRLLEDEGFTIGTFDDKDVVEHSTIKERSLYYDPKEERQLDMLRDILDPNRFISIQEELEKRNLPIGVNCILYGPPGTGKTEGVFQMAKHSGRDVLKVDISETRSKWFGDSEKLIKKVFTRYEALYGNRELAPILLFNEADAILSKRMDPSGSNVGQTMNTIQNILLEELECFKGIFIATTNLLDNLDKAFERRFLFKVQICRPGKEARMKMWKDKLMGLPDEIYHELSSKFHLSGGEIENITRKILMQEVIENKKVDHEQILGFCENEKFSKETKRTVGFNCQ